MTFESDTAVRPVAAGRYDAEIKPGWDVGGNANGGYLLAIAARAMRDAAGRPIRSRSPPTTSPQAGPAPSP